MDMQNLMKRDYEQAWEGKTAEDKQTILNKRLEKYGTICQLGIANLFWKGTTLVFKDMKAKEDSYLFTYIILFTVCLLLMAMGTVASNFPDSSPCPCFFSGLGALVAILSMFGSYHLDILAYFPSRWACYVSMILTSLAFTLYWAYAVQDPWIVHLLKKVVNWLCELLWFAACWIWNSTLKKLASCAVGLFKAWFEKRNDTRFMPLVHKT